MRIGSRPGGGGGTVSTNVLTLGEHTITASATDTSALTGVASITVMVFENVTQVGPVTDTEAGVTYLEKTVGVPAVNALAQSDRLLELLSPVMA